MKNNFIMLKGKVSGMCVFANLDNVIFMEPATNEGTRIYFADESEVEVYESINKILGIMSK